MQLNKNDIDFLRVLAVVHGKYDIEEKLCAIKDLAPEAPAEPPVDNFDFILQKTLDKQ